MGKILVAYFSISNKTKSVAEELSSKLNADIFEIKAKEPYTEEDLNWNSDDSRCSREMNGDPNIRPEIEGELPNMSEYDTILVGFPIWWGQAPRIINTFLENHDWSNKKLVCFSTSEGSGITGALDKLQASAYGVVELTGMALNDETAIDAFIKNLSE